MDSLTGLLGDSQEVGSLTLRSVVGLCWTYFLSSRRSIAGSTKKRASVTAHIIVCAQCQHGLHEAIPRGELPYVGRGRDHQMS